MTQDRTNPSAPTLIDARGLNCPLPVLKLRKILKALPPGTEVALLATDRTALRDVPAFCRAHDHEIQSSEEPDFIRFRIRKSADRSA